MQINEKFKDIDHVRILAKEAAQNNKEDQRIYPATYRGMEIFLYNSATFKKRGIELVPYTPVIEGGDVLQDNGDEQPEPVTKAKKKTIKAETPQSE